MKTKMKPRYYCDFCKKSGGHAGCMRTHEASCTKNPNRLCKMCKFSEFEQQPMASLIAAIKRDEETHEASTDDILEQCGPCNPKELETVSNGCPACMLAAIRQSGVLAEFDFENRKKNWFEEWHEAHGMSEVY